MPLIRKTLQAAGILKIDSESEAQPEQQFDEDSSMRKLVPSPTYLSQASKTPSGAASVSKKLLILDLNNVREELPFTVLSLDVLFRTDACGKCSYSARHEPS